MAVITGGCSGLGFETALTLARRGADVILAGRDPKAALDALSAIRQLAPGVLARFEKLDLANLQSVVDFAARLAAKNHPVDLLVHCASVPESAQRRETLDGFEMQLGVHFLGPFALTARLLPLLKRGRQPRVVLVSSVAHCEAPIHFEDLQFARGYQGRAAHCQSKLAALMFGQELQRRSDARGWRLRCALAESRAMVDPSIDPEPGRERSHATSAAEKVSEVALSILFAATSTTVRPGGLYGATGDLYQAGPPAPLRVDEKARCMEAAGRLWEAAEQLTGFYWPAER